MNKEEILNTFLLANIPEIITQEEFDDVKKAIFKMLKENKILKENSYHNDKVVDKVNWENQLLKKQIKTQDETNIQLISKLDRYDAIVDERDELKNQLTTYQILHRDCKVDNLKNISKIEEMENQQKEFIEYMNKTIEELECDDVDDEEMKGYLIQRIDTFKEILSKYKETIGVSDDKK